MPPPQPSGCPRTSFLSPFVPYLKDLPDIAPPSIEATSLRARHGRSYVIAARPARAPMPRPHLWSTSSPSPTPHTACPDLCPMETSCPGDDNNHGLRQPRTLAPPFHPVHQSGSRCGYAPTASSPALSESLYFGTFLAPVVSIGLACVTGAALAPGCANELRYHLKGSCNPPSGGPLASHLIMLPRSSTGLSPNRSGW